MHGAGRVNLLHDFDADIERHENNINDFVYFDYSIWYLLIPLHDFLVNINVKEFGKSKYIIPQIRNKRQRM